jgi:hypothetical protein
VITSAYQKSNINLQPGIHIINVVSYARNFKVRLMDADPEQERLKELAKDNYRKELKKQMQADRQRK